MNEEDSSAAMSENNSPNCGNIPHEKTCSERTDLNHTSDAPSSADTSIETPQKENTSSISNSKPSTSSGKSKRRSGGKKHRAGRNRHRRWKPYHKLTFEEKKKLDERNERRAQRMREHMSAVGIPVAPYNTSQFLINDYLSCHELKTPDYQNGDSHSHQSDSSNECSTRVSDDPLFHEHAFLEDYANIHEEYLNSLSQYELVAEWVSLEDKIEVADKQLRDLRDRRRGMGLDPEAEMQKIEVFQCEIEKLFEENQDLEVKNEKLRELLSTNVDVES